jgi:hypothetical protein
MAPLSAVVEEALRQAGVAGVAPAACALELKGKALDQRLPLRFANLPATAKLELKTGQVSSAAPLSCQSKQKTS